MTNTLSLLLILSIAATLAGAMNFNGDEETEAKRPEARQARKYPLILPIPRGRRSAEMTGFARIDRASGMIAFPRVGRSDSPDYDVVLEFNAEDISEANKRQGLIPYPRVGRSRDPPASFRANEMVKSSDAKRTGDAASNGGMWFGPRLGRLHRRDDERQRRNDQQRWSVYPLADFSGSGAAPRSQDLASRLGGMEPDQDQDQDQDGQGTSNSGVY